MVPINSLLCNTRSIAIAEKFTAGVETQFSSFSLSSSPKQTDQFSNLLALFISSMHVSLNSLLLRSYFLYLSFFESVVHKMITITIFFLIVSLLSIRLKKYACYFIFIFSKTWELRSTTPIYQILHVLDPLLAVKLKAHLILRVNCQINHDKWCGPVLYFSKSKNITMFITSF